MKEIPQTKLNTGAKMPVIGFGTWKLEEGEEVKRAMAIALDSGYRLIDTAMIYGNERDVGEAIKESGIPRKEIFVTTKLWNSYQGYKTALAAFDESLERLALDYVDLYLIHWPATAKRRESWRALSKLHKEGRARAIGVSNYTIAHLAELIEGSDVIPAVNQIELHPFIYKDQQPIVEFCQKHGIVIEAYSPLAQAHRINDPILATIAESFGKTPAQVMLRWALQHGTVPLPRSSVLDHIESNIEIFNFELSDDDMTAINNLSEGARLAQDPTEFP